MTTRPASKTLMAAIAQARAAAQAAESRAVQSLLDAALADDPTLAGGQLDLGAGVWTLPASEPAP